MSKNRGNKRAKKSSNWATRQNSDQFVRKAKDQGMRARSVYKLEQIDKKYRLIKPHSNIVDLGCAPGSWCQYLANKSTENGKVVGVDLLRMKEINNVKFIQGDFTDSGIQQEIINSFIESRIDLVLSDMAPNITGIRVTDQSNAAELQESILTFCARALNLRGNLLTKLFEGEAVSQVRKQFASYFDQVQMVKPDASRSESREVYLLARGFKPDRLDTV